MAALTRLENLGAAFGNLPTLPRLTLIALLALLMFLPGFATLPVTDRDEARFLQASRQMVQSGDPIDIRFQDAPRYKKPVGIYWAQSAAALLSGEAEDAPVWVFRLPSLLGAVAAVVLVAVTGAPLIGVGPAAVAAVLFAASLVLGGEARIAKTDAVLLALIMGMLAILARLHMAKAPPTTRQFAWIFWVCFGLGILVKGPIAPMVAGLTMLTVSILRREARWLHPLAAPLPMLAGFALFVPWLLAISAQSGGAFWQASVGDDLLSKAAAGQEGKGLPPGTYLVLLWLTFWPGSVVLAMALPRIWRRRAEPAFVFLLAWLIPVWLLFEAVPTKLIHYTLPVYPALALLAVAGFLGAPLPLSRWARGAGVALLLPGILLAGFGFSLLAQWQGPDDAVGLLVSAAALAVGFAVAAMVALHREYRLATVLLLTATGAVLHAGIFTSLARLPALWPSVQIYEAAEAAVEGRDCAAPRLVGWGYSEPSLVWLGGRETVLADGRAELPVDLLADPCTIIARDSSATAALPPNTTRIAQITGFAIGAGKQVRLDILQPEAIP
tara:strand:+ start:916 stop:2580 length:1665 start_codon:yes stop_codon:yes gene_type:complete